MLSSIDCHKYYKIRKSDVDVKILVHGNILCAFKKLSSKNKCQVVPMSV